MGCGVLGTPVPRHNTSAMVDMYDVWQWFQDNGEDLSFSMAGLNGFISATATTAAAAAADVAAATAATAGTAAAERAYASTTASVGNDNKGKVVPFLRQLSGYDTTLHAKTNNVRNQWNAFTPQDC